MNGSIKKNYIYNVILTISNLMFTIISFPYATRVLTPRGLGKVTFAIAIMTYLTMIAQLGIPTYGIREIAKIRGDKEGLSVLVHELLMLNIVMSAVSYAVFFVMIIAIPQISKEKVLYAIVSSMILLSTIGLEWLYKGLEEYSFITIVSVLSKILASALMFIYVKDETDYVFYGFLTVLASSSGYIFTYLYSKRYYKSIKKLGGIHKLNIKRHFRPAFVFFAMVCATTIYTNLDNVMLGFMKGDIEVGYYSVSIKITNIAVVVVTALGTVVLPKASEYIEKNMIEEFWRTIKGSFKFAVVMSSLFMVGMFILATPLVYIVSGSGYTASVLPLKILLPTIIFIALTNTIGMQIMVPRGKERSVLYSVIIGAVIDGMVNIILIPRCGAVGAAIGTLMAELSVLIYQYSRIRSELWKYVF